MIMGEAYPTVEEGWAYPDIWFDVGAARVRNGDYDGVLRALRNHDAWEASNEIRKMRARTRREFIEECRKADLQRRGVRQ